jgi:hypothetical protein
VPMHGGHPLSQTVKGNSSTRGNASTSAACSGPASLPATIKAASVGSPSTCPSGCSESGGSTWAVGAQSSGLRGAERSVTPHARPPRVTDDVAIEAVAGAADRRLPKGVQTRCATMRLR